MPLPHAPYLYTYTLYVSLVHPLLCIPVLSQASFYTPYVSPIPYVPLCFLLCTHPCITMNSLSFSPIHPHAICPPVYLTHVALFTFCTPLFHLCTLYCLPYNPYSDWLRVPTSQPTVTVTHPKLSYMCLCSPPQPIKLQYCNSLICLKY